MNFKIVYDSPSRLSFAAAAVFFNPNKRQLLPLLSPILTASVPFRCPLSTEEYFYITTVI